MQALKCKTVYLIQKKLLTWKNQHKKRIKQGPGRARCDIPEPCCTYINPPWIICTSARKSQLKTTFELSGNDNTTRHTWTWLHPCVSYISPQCIVSISTQNNVISWLKKIWIKRGDSSATLIAWASTIHQERSCLFGPFAWLQRKSPGKIIRPATNKSTARETWGGDYQGTSAWKESQSDWRRSGENDTEGRSRCFFFFFCIFFCPFPFVATLCASGPSRTASAMRLWHLDPQSEVPSISTRVFCSQ